MMKMAAIYARVSSEQQREENTIASQTASLIEFLCGHFQIVALGVVNPAVARRRRSSLPREIAPRFFQAPPRGECYFSWDRTLARWL
jgi:hypothetical protein